MHACAQGKEDVVACLLKLGANPHHVNVYKYTPLHWAAKNGNLNIIRALLNAKVDVNAQEQYGYSSLLLAVKKGHASMFISSG